MLYANYGVLVLPLYTLIAAWCSRPYPEGSLIIYDPEVTEVCRHELHLWDVPDLMHQVTRSPMV